MKHVLVVGGSGGIGRSISEVLAAQGYRVYSTYHRNPQENAGNISFHPLNVLDGEMRTDFLPDSLHGIVYCPGSINLLPFARIKPSDYLADYELQVVGAVRVLQGTLPKLKAAGTSSVVLFSTVAVQSGFSFHSLISASKGAVEGLTRALAAELAPSIRVNAIAPSITDTPLAAKLLGNDEKRSANAQRHPMKRIGTPADMAEAAAFLLSDKSGWITGQVLPVDGGMSAIR